MSRRTIAPPPSETTGFDDGTHAPSGSEPAHAGGHATTAGTRRFAERLTHRLPDFRSSLPRALTATVIGLGTYLGDCTEEDDSAYRETIRTALSGGVNVFDTAINYRCRRSERALGQALREAIGAGEVRRDEIIVCTKGGYVALDGEPPASREAYERWLDVELFSPGIVSREEMVRGGHSIAPRYLAYQLAASRDNLGLRTIDLYYLHNPEEQLLALDRPTFIKKLRLAFSLLEERAASGEIAAYGCATWTGLRVGPEHRQHLTLADLVAIAREVGGTTHHFRSVQLPINLMMPEAARVPTQPLGRRLVTLLEAADALGIGVVASASLMQGRLASSLPPELHELFADCSTDAQRALRFAASLPGVNVVLAGMRRREHLTENLDAWRA